MPKILFVVAQNGFRDEELLEPKKILEERGIETLVASKNKGKAFGKLGVKIDVDLALAEAEADDFAALIFVGGPGAADYFQDQTAWDLVREFEKKGKLIAAICIAPSILANAGLLIGKRVTAYPTEEKNLVDRGAEYTGMPVEVDGKIITAKDPTAAFEFGEKIAWELGA